MIGFSRKFKRPISALVMDLVYWMLGWDVAVIYVINPFAESYIRLECRRDEE